jgi:hypothetical protein
MQKSIFAGPALSTGSPSSLAAHDGSEGTGPIAADDDGKGVDKPAAGAAAVGRRGVADSAVEEYGGAGGRSVPPGLRGVYSFCMCPGGQIVCTSTTPEELCLNGMSFRCSALGVGGKGVTLCTLYCNRMASQ